MALTQEQVKALPKYRIGDRVRRWRYPDTVGTVIAYERGLAWPYLVRLDDGTTTRMHPWAMERVR